MADFKTHSLLGSAGGIGLGVFAAMNHYVSPVRCVLAASIFAMASVLPDLDSDNGTAKRFLFETIAVLLPALVITQSAFATTEQAFLIILVIYLVIRYLVGFIFAKCTTHRGIFHSIPMALVFGFSAGLLFIGSPAQVRLIYAAACFAGYAAHLLIDEIWSFGFFGLGVKKSFGTALKFHCDSIPAVLLTYAAMIALAYFFYVEILSDVI